MRSMVWSGLVVIFISTFFIIFTLDRLVISSTLCILGHVQCNPRGAVQHMVIGIVFFILFILIDIITIYILKSSLATK